MSNIIEFDETKNISFIIKRKTVCPYFGLNELLKFDSANKKINDLSDKLRRVNYLDSLDHHSSSCMHIYSNQQFLEIEQYIVSTSTELILLGKMRPIDFLFNIIQANFGDEEKFFKELNDFIKLHTIYETTYMFLLIIINKNLKFYIAGEGSNGLKEISNNSDIMSFARKIYLKISVKFDLGEKQDNIKSSFDDNIVNIIGEASGENQSNKLNNISYSLYMYLARIARLFIDENIFTGDTERNVYIEVVKIHHLKFIINQIEEYQASIIQLKQDLINKFGAVQKTSKDNSRANNESIYLNFQNFQKDIENIVYLCEIIQEGLKFIKIMNETSNLRKHIKKGKASLINRILSLKFRDIIYQSNIVVLKEWIELYFESMMHEKEIKFMILKLQELGETCPNIFSQQDREIIIADILIKNAQSKNLDVMQKKSLVSKAVNLIIQYPDSLPIIRVISILGPLGEISEIINIASTKAVYLKKNLDYSSENSLIQRNNDEQNLIELKECLYTIFKILSELTHLIRNPSYKSDAPPHINALFTSIDKESLYNCRIKCIQEIIKQESEFLHYLLFEQIEDQEMLGELNSLESPFLESYLKKMLEMDKTDPMKHLSIFKFQLKMKDYYKAYQTCLTLLNFVNSIDSSIKVSLQDRKTFLNNAFMCLEHLIQKKDERNLPDLQRTKINLFEIKYVLQIQESILYSLRTDLNKSGNNFELKIKLESVIQELERSLLSLSELYEYSNSLGLFSECIEIFFTTYKLFDKSLYNSFTHKEIYRIYENHINSIINKENDYHNCLIKHFDKIFGFWKNEIPELLKLKDDPFDKLIPLVFIVNLIEKKNQAHDDFNKDFDVYIEKSYEEKENPFWFIIYLLKKVELSIINIFNFYNGLFNSYTNYLLEKESDEMHFMVVHYIICILAIFKIWINQVENGIIESNKNKEFLLIFDEYDQNKQYISDFLHNSFFLLGSRNLKLLISAKENDKIKSFLKNVENKSEKVNNMIIKLNNGEKIDITDKSFTSQANISKLDIKSDQTAIKSDSMIKLDDFLEENIKEKSFKKMMMNNPQSNEMNTTLENYN